MRFAVLGPLRVFTRSDVALNRPSHRRLLSILLLEPGRPLETDVIIDRFWAEEPPDTARAALQTYVSQVRKLLGNTVITTTVSGYQVDLRGHHLDRQLFDAMASATQTAVETGAWEEVIQNADQALELWRGPPYEEIRDDEFARPEIVRLEEQRLELIELRAEALLALGRNEEALPGLEGLVLDHPLRERLWEHLMVARARLGRVTEAVQAYQQVRELLAEMGLEPSPVLRDLEERILREDPVLVPGRVRHNLPTSLTTFIGRKRERAELGSLMDEQRLVTVAGVGGSGKTRLSAEVTRERLARYPDGVWMVDLAPLSEQTLVTSAVAVAIGLRAETASAGDAITDALRHRQTLVVLDNCEHLVEAAAAVATVLLASGPGVSVLATSREQLGVPGEAIYPISPLDVPPEDQADATQLRGFASVALFTDRAALSSNGFSLTDDNAVAVASICRRLDGLPLAIELAAARMRSLSAADVADRLAARLGLVTGNGRGLPSRQQAMEATIEWSHRLLTDAEQTLFARLSVFTGGFTASSAEEVCAGDGVSPTDVVQLLSRLVDKSLVVPLERADGAVRHRFLETVREYAGTRLQGSGDAVDVRRRHRDHFHRLARELIDGNRAAAVAQLQPEADNLEAALDWSLEQGHAPEAADLAAALATHWLHLGHSQPAIGHLARTLDEMHNRLDPEHEVLLRIRLAGARFGAGEEDEALAEAARARELLADAKPSVMKVRALMSHATYLALAVHQDPRPALEAAVEALEVARATDDRRAEAAAIRKVGWAEAWTGDADRGIAHAREALAIAEELDDPAAIGEAYDSYMEVLWLHGDARRREPRRLVEEILSRFGGPEGHWIELLSAGWVIYTFMQSGEWDRAEDVLQRVAGQELVAYEQIGFHHARGSLRWMQGRLDDAAADVAALRRLRPMHRWNHDILPLEAEVAADVGRLDQVRATAAEYLAARVHASEESMKAAVLRPLVAAEVDAALMASGPDREDHARRATDAVTQMRSIIERYPPLASGSVQYETPATNLLIAEAELSRLSAPDPDAWRGVNDRADLAYWRLYAGWRLADALLETGRRDEGIRELRHARDVASIIGAERITGALDALAQRAGITSARR